MEIKIKLQLNEKTIIINYLNYLEKETNYLLNLFIYFY